MLKACEVSRELIFVCNRLHTYLSHAAASYIPDRGSCYIFKKMSKIEIDIIESADSEYKLLGKRIPSFPNRNRIYKLARTGRKLNH